ncbi:MAG: helix-turn-helix domain-containing protein [Naasia sp.]
MNDGREQAPGLLSASQVAERLGVSHRHVNRLVNTEAIPIVGVFGIQKQLVFREEDIDQYIEQHPS